MLNYVSQPILYFSFTDSWITLDPMLLSGKGRNCVSWHNVAAHSAFKIQIYVQEMVYTSLMHLAPGRFVMERRRL